MPIRSTAVHRATSVTWLKKPVYVPAFPACPGSGRSLRWAWPSILMIILQNWQIRWTDTCVTLTPAVQETTPAALWAISASGAAVRCQRLDVRILNHSLINTMPHVNLKWPQMSQLSYRLIDHTESIHTYSTCILQ